MSDPSLEEFAEVNPPMCVIWPSYTMRQIDLS
jgi:hypothetical protein